MLESRAFVFLLIGKASSFAMLERAEREHVLLALAGSRFALLRKAFQGIKRLALFYLYALNDQQIDRAIGYEPARAFPASAPRIALSPADDSIDCDVCVIGSGAGGGVIAAELSKAGLRVVVLEAAPPLQSGDFDQRELLGMQNLFLNEGKLATRDLSMIVVAGSALGGGTAVNWQTSLRTPDDVRTEWNRRSGLDLFSSPSFDASLDAVLEGIHVDTDESAFNGNNDVLRRGCDALGYAWSVIPRNSRGCDPAQCGYCMFGCRHGGKQSTAVTCLATAVRNGARIIGDCRAERVEIANGRVTGVTARAGERTIRVNCARAVVAGGGIESPLLLQRSGVRLPQVGRHLLLHPTTCVVGIHEEPIRTWSGPPQTVVCGEFADLGAGYGVRLESAPAHPGLAAFALPWHGAAAHEQLMRSFSRAAVIIALARDHEGGRVWQGARGHTLIDYQPGTRELGYIVTGMIAAARIHHAAGAKQIVMLHSKPCVWEQGQDFDAFIAAIRRLDWDRNWAPLFSAHQMGTCRMGSGADSAVCDGNGQVFGVSGLFIADASAFPGSSGVNPMITIMALAHHTAQRMLQLV